jgi:hypothetical protein
MSREHFDIGKDVSNPNLSTAANNYAASLGLIRPNRIQHALVNYSQARNIAQEYEAAPEFDKSAVPAFKKFGEETERQFDFLTRPKSRGGLGINVEVSEDDPYKRARDMMEDIRHNARLRVLSTASTGGHPYLTNDQNNMFRAVHDAFGHAATGRGFDPHGEEAAYRSHVSMFTPLARDAMTTETRGQNSALNFGSDPGKFVVQKIVRLSPESQLITPIGRRAAFQQAMLDAKKAHIRAFGE